MNGNKYGHLMSALADKHLGTYGGSGQWHDETGASQVYTATLTLNRTAKGLTLSFRHVFHEDPAADDVHMTLTLSPWPKSPSLLTFDLGPTRGRGYQDADLLHYDIPLPATLVSATYRFTDTGICLVNGSSDSNADGNYIMWTERLSRT